MNLKDSVIGTLIGHPRQDSSKIKGKTGVLFFPPQNVVHQSLFKREGHHLPFSIFSQANCYPTLRILNGPVIATQNVQMQNELMIMSST